MTMLRKVICLFGFGFLTSTFLAPLPAKTISSSDGPWSGSWAFERSQLDADSRVTWSRMDNGLRYALLPHKGVPERVSLRLLVLVGSVEETVEELGIAHFIEHMAFNGTRNFPADEMSQFFLELGMEYGHDVNAQTAFDHTVYGLEFWENSEPLLRRGLTLFRDMADGISFKTEEINKERNVILSEMRSRDGLGLRTQWSAFQLFFKGLSFTNRLPIGTTESLNGLTRDHFLKFYKRWYRPDLMVVVAIGDFDAGRMGTMIEEQFGSITYPTRPLPQRNVGAMARSLRLRASTYRISHVGSAQIQVASVVPPAQRPVADSIEARRQDFYRQFAMSLLLQRMRGTIPAAGDGSAEFSHYFNHGAAIASISIDGRGWEDGVVSLDRVIRFTEREGFEAHEIEKLRQSELVRTRKMSIYYPKLDPTPIADGLIQSILEDRVFIGLDRELALHAQILGNIDVKRIHRTFAEMWDLDRLAFHLSGEFDIEDDPPRKIREAVAKARQGRASIYLPQNEAGLDYEPVTWLVEGKVVEERVEADFGVHLLRFDNEVRMNFIETQSEPGLMSALVRVGGGLFDLKRSLPGLREFALQAVLGSGTKRHAADQIQRILATEMIDFSFDTNDHDAFSFRGAFGPERLEAFLGIVSEYLSGPEIYKYSYRDAKMGAAMHRYQSAVGMQDGYRAFTTFMFEGDDRFAWGTRQDYSGLGVTDVREWLEEPLARGFVEVSIVGDVGKEAAVSAVARTLGTLKKRRSEKRNPFPQRSVEVSASPGFHRIEFVGEEHQAAVVGIWEIEGELSFNDRMALEALGRILEARMRKRLREDLGLTYSPSADFSPFLEYPDFATIRANVDCSPDDATNLAHAILEISEEIAEQGIRDKEVKGALGPIKVKVRQALRSNDYLLHSILMRAQERPANFEEARALQEGILSTLTVEEVNGWARKIMVPENTRVAAIVPRAFIGIFQTGPQGL